MKAPPARMRGRSAMQTHDAEQFRAAIVPAAAVTVLAAIVGALVVGSAGAAGALVAGVVVTAFFGLGHAVSSRLGDAAPVAVMAAALVTYVLKVVLLGTLLVVAGGSS